MSSYFATFFIHNFPSQLGLNTSLFFYFHAFSGGWLITSIGHGIIRVVVVVLGVVVIVVVVAATFFLTFSFFEKKLKALVFEP